MCLLLAAILFLGLVIFAWRYVVNGAEWVSFYGNTQIFSDGNVNRGSVYDRNGALLINCTKDGLEYPEDSELRKATVHVVGDPTGNIPDGAINKFRSQLIGYDILNGTYETNSVGKSITLTIDAEANRRAYEELSPYKSGVMAIMNYKTGEIVCQVSTPSFDPLGDASDDPESSIYFNNFYQGLITPGSTFKLVTGAAAIDNLPDLAAFEFECDGVNEYEDSDLTCVEPHGYQDFSDAMANSCNGAFGKITRELGADVMNKYVDELGLTGSIDVNGIKTAKGSFNFDDSNPISLSWSGCGQGQDQVNPCAMLVYVAAIANDGEAIEPVIIKGSNFLEKLGGGSKLGRYIESDTATRLKELMKNNVVESYGEYNFEGLDIYAKSGTAEVGDEKNALFTGFIDDEEHPYAFFCWLEDGGAGSVYAGAAVRNTLYSLIG